MGSFLFKGRAQRQSASRCRIRQVKNLHHPDPLITAVLQDLAQIVLQSMAPQRPVWSTRQETA